MKPSRHGTFKCFRLFLAQKTVGKGKYKWERKSYTLDIF